MLNLLWRGINKFKDCIDGIGLCDLTGSGCLYTWCNKQEGEDRILCKLGRAMGNDQWFLNNESSTEFLPMGM